MEPTTQAQTPPPQVCSLCHQPTLPQYYFCPNCGTKLQTAPLSTSLGTTLWIYFLSIILPSFAFIFIAKWKGIDYLRSKDKKAKTIGIIACTLLLVSTLLTFWYAYKVTQRMVQASLNTANVDMGGY